LKQSLRTSCDVVAILHNNAKPHTIEILHQLNVDHLFGPFRDASRGRHFASDREVKEVVHTGLVAEPKVFFS
jgi:hypothetical protein